MSHGRISVQDAHLGYVKSLGNAQRNLETNRLQPLKIFDGDRNEYCWVAVQLQEHPVMAAIRTQNSLYSTLLSNPASAISAARNKALALFCVSIHSLFGTESATIPAPA
jgi:hypothetical protein